MWASWGWLNGEEPLAGRSLEDGRERYNTLRPHWALRPVEGGDPLVPAEVYTQGRAVEIPKWQPWARAARAKLQAILEVAA